MTTVTIGNFDGVHIGHQALLRRATEVANGGEIVAVTFDLHPAGILRGVAPGELIPLAQRKLRLREAGATRIEILHATKELLALEPEDFVNWLRTRIKFTTVVEGADFRFGRDRSGGVATLERLGQHLGFEAIKVDEVEVALTDGHVARVRSSTIRWLLSQGRVADAARMLGRPHRVSGIVVEGMRRGTVIGFPTANIDAPGALLPADGVYAVRVHLGDGRSWLGAASVGTNPTFGSAPRTLEVHLLGAPEGTDLYGALLSVEFTAWIREMLAFDSVERLVIQMRRDCDMVGA